MTGKNELSWFWATAKRENWLNQEQLKFIEQLLCLNYEFSIIKWDKSIYRKMFWMSEKSHIKHNVEMVAKITDNAQIKINFEFKEY